MRFCNRHRNRSGSVLVFTAVMMIVMFAMVAFAVDIGYLQVVRSELQTCADSAAMAAAWELIDEDVLTGTSNPVLVLEASRDRASNFASWNRVAGSAPALGADDITIGYRADPEDSVSPMDFSDPNIFNAIRIRVQRTEAQNGSVSLFFARILGIDSSDQHAEATAMFLNNLSGFKVPTNGENLDIMPFAIDLPTWESLFGADGKLNPAGHDDNWAWTKDENNPDQGTLGPGSDKIPEINLYPEGIDAPGNRGTVDIGSNDNSTADIARQILNGVTEADLAHHGGKLQFENGEILLNGDTGISAAVKAQLEAIVGETRIVPVFSAVVNPGNNCQYTIVRFVGIRILDVQLTGINKSVTIQPAMVKVTGGIPGSGPPQSNFVHSGVWLVR